MMDTVAYITRWVKSINALVLHFPQIHSVRVVSLDPCIGFFQMMGRVLGQIIYHICQVMDQLAAGMQAVSQ